MARITVEDCLDNVENLFELVTVAAKRARRLANGAEPMLEWENDKPTVMALREIAAGMVGREILDDIDTPDTSMMTTEQAEEMLTGTPLPDLDDHLDR